MEQQSLEQGWARAYELVSKGDMEGAAKLLSELVERDPEAPEGWINLASAERSLGQLHAAAGHYERGIALLEKLNPEDRGLIASAQHALAGTWEALEQTGKAIAAYEASAKNDPRAPTPLASLAVLLARAGRLEEADRVATKYCMGAVSILAEKANIGLVRRFQKALKHADSVDGKLLLVATREAYVMGWEQTARKLPEGARFETEPLEPDESGAMKPVLPDPRRPFARVRFDALDPQSGERWMIQDSPTYGFPGSAPAAADGLFSVPMKAAVPFPVRIATRTAWDYFYVRLRFANGLRETTLENAERLIGGWYLRGFEGEFSEGERGYFHYLSEPFPIGAHGVRYEIDLGLARIEAVDALFAALTELHRVEPIDLCVLGDGALPE